LELERQVPEAVDAIITDLFAHGDESFRGSVVTPQEGEFLRRLASGADIRNTVEVGFANGISTLYICSGTAAKPNARHTAIDPGQRTVFKGNGIANVKRAGFDFLRLIEEPSEVALPRLLQEGEIFDLAFIDGWHTADQTMLDFYYVDRIVRPGGIVIFDDATMPSVNKVLHYIAKIPNYKLIGSAGKRGTKRRIINYAKAVASVPCWPLKKIFGEGLMREFVDDAILNPGTLWSLDFCSMVAFQKTGRYDRGTEWYAGM